MKIAISSCLLGAKVRFDGGHKHDRFITDALGNYADFIPFCPEHLAFGTPRASIRLVKKQGNIKAHSNKTADDVTHQLLATSNQELESLKNTPLRAIIFKSKSPSCGLESALVYRNNGYAEGKDDGIFAKLCKAHFPLLPMEEEGRLCDPWLRENFIMQVFAYDDFEQFKESNPDMKSLVEFHQSYKLMLQAKHENTYRTMGNLVGNHEKLPLEVLLHEYELLFKKAIGEKSSIGKTRNVLEHMAGFVRDNLSHVEKSTLHEQIKDYANKIIPLITPLSTLSMFAQKYNIEYLRGQKFLNPYPKELALRSDIRSGK